MNELGFLIGATLGCVVLTSLLYAPTLGWPKSIGKSLYLNLLSFLLATLLSAIGAADGGPPNFGSTLYYLAGQSVVFVLDVSRIAFLRWRAARAALAH